MKVSVHRLEGNPILRPFMERRMGANLCGPSLIRTPEWLAGRLGRYHLYFAHHLGSYIRLAYADRLQGPWRIHAPGVLDIAQVPMLYEHLASPDVHIDEERRELRMYFHGVSAPEPFECPEQSTCVAHSFDGITFAVRHQLLGESYFRAWQWDGEWYALALGGVCWRSADGIAPFEHGARLSGFAPTTRHPAVLRKGWRLWVAWTITGDRPERVYLGWVDLRRDWQTWAIEDPREILRPEHEWEGVEMPDAPSRVGIAYAPEKHLRDPAFYSENGGDYLLYNCAGESGIAIARIKGLTEGRGI